MIIKEEKTTLKFFFFFLKDHLKPKHKLTTKNFQNIYVSQTAPVTSYNENTILKNQIKYKNPKEK